MIYSFKARVGAIRSNPEQDEIAVLMRVQNIEENYRSARWISLLYVSARPWETAAVVVQCHNGSRKSAEREVFWRRETGTCARYCMHENIIITSLIEKKIGGGGGYSPHLSTALCVCNYLVSRR